MNRFTISLSEERYLALKEAADRRGGTVEDLVDSALENYGIGSCGQAADLVRRVRAASTLESADALGLALREQEIVRRSASE